LETENHKIGKITHCPFDVTGLFETVQDLINDPRIIEELLSIPALRDYIVNLRHGVITVMLGYSDSVREGSSLASDAQVRLSFIFYYKLIYFIFLGCQDNNGI